MAFHLVCRSDEEVVARVRYWHPFQMRWRRAIFGLIGLAIVLLFATLIGEAPDISRRFNALMQTPYVNVRSYSAGYVAGLSLGGLLGGALTFCISGLFFVVVDLQRDRLLLAYHDQLQKAGLLPAEASGKMEVDQKTTEA